MSEVPLYTRSSRGRRSPGMSAFHEEDTKREYLTVENFCRKRPESGLDHDQNLALSVICATFARRWFTAAFRSGILRRRSKDGCPSRLQRVEREKTKFREVGLSFSLNRNMSSEG